jgi:hypothetical protein
MDDDYFIQNNQEILFMKVHPLKIHECSSIKYEYSLLNYYVKFTLPISQFHFAKWSRLLFGYFAKSTLPGFLSSLCQITWSTVINSQLHVAKSTLPRYQFHINKAILPNCEVQIHFVNCPNEPPHKKYLGCPMP